MIKRRFYRQDHGDKDDFSDSSSSSSDSDVEAQSSGASEEAGEEAEEVSQEQQDELSDRVNLQVPSSSSSSSGDESEDSSADELDANSSGKNEKHRMVEALAKDLSLPDGVGKWILKSKSVFKCRLCPKVVCLNEETLKTHIKSKRHARSEKLQSNGKLKHMLNSDGEDEVLESDGETHAERHARILALAQPTSCQEEKPNKRPQGRQRQRLRKKRKQEINTPSSKETGQNVSSKETSENLSSKKTSHKRVSKETSQNVSSKKTSQKRASKETSLKVSTKETSQKVKRRRQNV